MSNGYLAGTNHSTDHKPLDTIHSILKQYWGYASFRPLQQEIIASVLAGNDTLALLPTGGGKSLCYQVPALAREGLCLVISPLIALMKDQVENLRKKGITAYAIYSGMSRKEVINVLNVATNSNCKFLYVSPERLETNLFKEYLPGLHINLVAVDEAHCISQWGYDFRPPYLRIAALREELDAVPILAVTASATPLVQEDICTRLEFKEQRIFRQSFERPNLSYSVFKVESRHHKLTDILQKVPGSGIVYCRSRRQTQDIAHLLQSQGILADFYHAGLPQEERSRKQEDWIQNRTRIIVCTNAFGMGIDKPDVRIVVHAEAPDNLENYYQEAGRAGRDGQKSYAVLLYEATEPDQLRALPDIHYPPVEKIREVYQAVTNYLQVPSGLGEGSYYDFDLNDFLKKFRLDVQLVIHSLKALEQAEWISLNEQVFIPSKVCFTTNKRALYDFEEEHPELEPVVKALLRNYEGIFDYPTPVSEKTIAYLLKTEVEQAQQWLVQLQQYRLIKYVPKKDSPQLYFIRNRVAQDRVSIDTAAYAHRKKLYEERVQAMLQYLEVKACRSQYIATYFGDTATAPCGVCDNCLQQKRKPLDIAEFESIRQRIETVLEQHPVAIHHLLEQLQDIHKDKTWEVLRFLQTENTIQVEADGRMYLSRNSSP